MRVCVGNSAHASWRTVFVGCVGAVEYVVAVEYAAVVVDGYAVVVEYAVVAVAYTYVDYVDTCHMIAGH